MTEIIGLTQLSKNAKDSLLRSFVTKEDLLGKINELKEAWNSSAKSSVIAEIAELTGIKDLKTGENLEYYEEIVNDFCKEHDLDVKKSVIQILYDTFDGWFTPKDYMNRIVNNLLSPEDYAEWKDNSLRLKILKQFIKYTNYLKYKRFDGETPTGKEKKRTVCILSGDGSETFIKSYVEGRTGTKPKTTEDVLENLDDDIFSTYRNEYSAKINELDTQIKNLTDTRAIARLKERKKAESDKYALLRMCEDLAEGNFRQNSTKKHLYLFAMAFKMDYFAVSPDDNSDSILKNPKYDIEKNLFADYYNNNIMRFCADIYEEKANAFELDPTGQGINYKNFAEMIYIYYIYQDLKPAEKIEKSNELIEKLKNSPVPENQNDGTKFFREIFTYEIVNLSEQDFEEFIKNNYDCRTNSRSPIQVNDSRNTAFEVYQEIIKKLDRECEKLGTSKETCFFGLEFVDSGAGKEELMRELKKLIKNPDEEKLNRFANLLIGFDRFAGDRAAKTGTLKYLALENAEDITRTAIIIAYYCLYNLKYNGEKAPFSAVYDDYCSEIKGSLNNYLERAGFRKISDKNLFDILIIFSSYNSINI